VSFDLNDYSDVAERIQKFYDKYPEGRLVTVGWDVKGDLGGNAFVWVHAKAYRDPDDPLPGDGVAWEPVPGPTKFTLNSELMNAQTAAWGRAIVALGFKTKKIASADEVRNRQAEDVHGFQESRADNVTGDATDKQKAMIRRLAKKLELDAGDVDSLTKSQASAKIEELLAAEAMEKDAVAVGGGGSDLDDIPFGPVIA
jgi:hypothetical protein